eukprot:TRINITY_DN2538_c0_g1_i7.p2 TRINITY_DN2538_c0_g1~~TRINITY_DN2538_c0_g1_i7.p2  ORF type:complete len:169 (+),score=39.93 TRINITY_DN2538_c0_g1_i7:464-970(+)
MALVAQEPAVFSTSVRDNIAYGFGPTAVVTDAAVEAAARTAAAHAFIIALPDGYATRLGDGGTGLSGASGSAFAWRGRSSAGRRCCSSTRPRRRSTWRRSGRCRGPSTRRRRGGRPSLSPTGCRRSPPRIALRSCRGGSSSRRARTQSCWGGGGVRRQDGGRPGWMGV